MRWPPTRGRPCACPAGPTSASAVERARQGQRRRGRRSGSDVAVCRAKCCAARRIARPSTSRRADGGRCWRARGAAAAGAARIAAQRRGRKAHGAQRRAEAGRERAFSRMLDSSALMSLAAGLPLRGGRAGRQRGAGGSRLPQTSRGVPEAGAAARASRRSARARRATHPSLAPAWPPRWPMRLESSPRAARRGAAAAPPAALPAIALFSSTACASSQHVQRAGAQAQREAATRTRSIGTQAAAHRAGKHGDGARRAARARRSWHTPLGAAHSLGARS